MFRYLSFVLVLSLVACGSNEEISTVPANLKLIHEPFSNSQKPYDFYGGYTDAKGRLIARGDIDATESASLFVTGPDFSRFVKVGENSSGSIFISQADLVVYILRDKLYTRTISGQRNQISGTEIVSKFWMSHDNNKVIYLANRELYVVNLNGTNRFKVNNSEPGRIGQYSSDSATAPHRLRPRFLPDMSRLVYVYTLDSTSQSHLHSIAADGTDPKVYSSNILATESVGNAYNNTSNLFAFTFSPDSSRIIFNVARTDAGFSNKISDTLYSVPSDGSAEAIAISGNMVAGGRVNNNSWEFTAAVTPDSSKVIFIADAETLNTYELFVVPITGGTRVKLSGTTAINPSLTPKILSDSSAVIYANDAYYKAAITGGTPTALNTGYTFNPRRSPDLTQDESAVVFIAETGGVENIYIAKTDGSGTQPLSAITNPDINTFPTYIHDKAGRRLVYVTETETLGDQILYLVDYAGNRTSIIPTKDYPGTARTHYYGFANNKIYYVYPKKARALDEIFAYDIATGNINSISDNWPSFISEDAKHLVQSQDGLVQAFQVDTHLFRAQSLIIARGQEQTSCRISILSTTLLNGGANFFMGPLGQYVYYSTLDNPNWQQYRANTNDCSNINISATQYGNLERMKVSPDGNTLIMAAPLVALDNDGNNERLLSSATSAGGVLAGNEGGFAFTPDSNRVLYIADQDTADVMELYWSTPDGTAGGKINLGLVVGGNVNADAYEGFTPKFTSDSQYVVYRAQQDNDFMELYKASTNGTSNIKLSGTLAAGSAVRSGSGLTDVLITPNDQYVVYLVWNASNGSELYSAPMDASTPPQKLHTATTQNGRILNFDSQPIEISFNSQYVVYIHGDSNSPYQVWSANVDGSDRRRLNGNLVQGGEVERFSVTPDGSKVVYYAKELDEKTFGLFVNNIAGGTRLHLANTLGMRNRGIRSDIERPILTNDNRAIFRSDTNGDGIYIVSLNGGQATKLFAIPAGRNIRSLQFSPAGALMIIGDLRLEGVNEVFVLEL